VSEPLRLGVTGFGRLARGYYLPALRTIPDARVVAVADPLPESRAAAAERLPSVDLYPDPSAMLERARLDALLVASPPSSHLPIWKDAAARGLAVFMEKPFVLSAQLPQLEQANPSARLMLDFNRRFWPTYQRVGELVRAGTLGKPVEVDFLLRTDVLSWSTVTRHRLAAEEGGILHDLGGHAIDLAIDLLRREPETVAAEAGSHRWPNDHVRLALVFADGSAFRCELAYGDRSRERLSILGPGGRLHLADPNMAIHVERNGAHGPRIAARCMDGAIFGYRALRRDRTMSRSSIRRALTSFVRSLREGTPFSPGFEDAVRNALWVEAAARSAADGGAAMHPA
jgi:predicted dehydrogenase